MLSLLMLLNVEGDRPRSDDECAQPSSLTWAYLHNVEHPQILKILQAWPLPIASPYVSALDLVATVRGSFRLITWRDTMVESLTALPQYLPQSLPGHPRWAVSVRSWCSTGTLARYRLHLPIHL